MRNSLEIITAKIREILNFADDMEGRITFLGTGTSSGIPMIGCTCPVCTSTDSRDRRLRTSAYVEYGGSRIIIDAGPDFREQMLRAGITSPDAILLTHAHMDHIGGMDDVRSFNYFQKKAFPVYCEERVERAVRQVFHYAFEVPKYPGAPDIDIRSINASELFKVGGATILPVRIMHGKLPILAYRFGPLGYITDGSFISEESLKAFEGISVLVISAVSSKHHPSHFTLQEALDIAGRLGAEKTYLTHLSHRLSCHQTLKESLPDGVEPAFDGLSVEF